ncbi:MAG: hypothetical protein ACLRTA_05105 [Clostridia bacterium]
MGQKIVKWRTLCNEATRAQNLSNMPVSGSDPSKRIDELSSTHAEKKIWI